MTCVLRVAFPPPATTALNDSRDGSARTNRRRPAGRPPSRIPSGATARTRRARRSSCPRRYSPTPVPQSVPTVTNLPAGDWCVRSTCLTGRAMTPLPMIECTAARRTKHPAGWFHHQRLQCEAPPFCREVNAQLYRGTSLIRNTHPPRITISLKAWGYCRVLRGGVFFMSEESL